jgi:hypothetical protein
VIGNNRISALSDNAAAVQAEVVPHGLGKPTEKALDSLRAPGFFGC